MGWDRGIAPVTCTLDNILLTVLLPCFVTRRGVSVFHPGMREISDILLFALRNEEDWNLVILFTTQCCMLSLISYVQ